MSFVKSLVAVIGFTAVVVPGVWFLADLSASAEGSEEKTATLEQAVKTLTDIHVRQETVEEAERRLKEKLCAEGKLKGDDCK